MATDATHPSSSSWVWYPDYRLYFNPSTNVWGKPLPDGTWEYAPADKQATKRRAEDKDGSMGAKADDKSEPERSRRAGAGGRGGSGVDGRHQVAYGDIDDGEVDPIPIPTEQVWPGDEPEADFDPLLLDPFAKSPLLRLVVLKRPPEAVLPLLQVVASISPEEPVSIGRDKSFERRVRLKELAVSKDHATVFWSVEPEMEEGGYWALVDSGSTHGTFLSSEGMGRTRLSESKVASKPHRLHHLECVAPLPQSSSSYSHLLPYSTLHIGSTTFSIHIHPSFACSTCSITSDQSNLISLTSSPSTGTDADANKSTYAGHKTKEEKEEDRRGMMRGLKDKFLKSDFAATSTGATSAATSKPTPTASASSIFTAPTPLSASSPAYIDRAAARRHRDGHTTASAKLAASSTSSSTRTKPAAPSPSPFFSLPGSSKPAFSSAPVLAAPPLDPFGSDSKGARMLSKLSGGGSSGAAGGAGVGGVGGGGGTGLGTLIQPRVIESAGLGGGREATRPGLGSRKLVEIETVAAGTAGEGGGEGEAGAGGKRDWREDVREKNRKRFREMGG